MSQADSSSVQNSADGEQSTEAVKIESTDVQRVLKEVGLTSATFIGPTFPSEKKINDSLNDFYKELQEIDSQAQKEQDFLVQPETSISTPLENLSWQGNVANSPTEGRSRPPEKHMSRPHWYKNEPYSIPRNHHHYYPSPAFHPSPDARSFHNFRQPSFPNSHNFHPPPFRDHRYPSRFPPFPRYPSVPRYNHPNWDFDDGGSSYGSGWCQEAPQCYFSEDQSHQQPYDESSSYVLILMRGLPGSGKTTMARTLLPSGPSGLILSTDDYFVHNDGYRYEPSLLGEAHVWNHRRASDAMHDGHSPIIIDNTNLQAWEMKPYVQMALQMGYRVDFCEPNTSWKYDPHELEKRNKHGVTQEKIAQMLDRFSNPISVDVVLSSQEPQHVHQRR
ncbi:NEDD4-binding protein 2-like 2 [Stigmatopora argus]